MSSVRGKGRCETERYLHAFVVVLLGEREGREEQS